MKSNMCQRSKLKKNYLNIILNIMQKTDNTENRIQNGNLSFTEGFVRFKVKINTFQVVYEI